MKRIFSVIALCLAMLFLLTSCGSLSAMPPVSSPPSAIGGVTGQSSEKTIALIDYRSQQETGFGQSVWAALGRFAGENGLGCDIYTAVEEDLDPTLQLAQKSGAEIVIMLGDELGEKLQQAQKKYPELHFFLLNSSGQWDLLKNSASQQFLVEQAGWLTGYTAVMNGERKLGAITTTPQNRQEQRCLLGFALGAEAAAAKLGLPAGSIELRTATLPAEQPEQALGAQFNLFASLGVKAVYLPVSAALAEESKQIAEQTGLGLLLTGDDATAETVLFATHKNPEPALKKVLAAWKSGEFPAAEQIQSGLLDGGIGHAAGPLWAETATDQQYVEALAVFKNRNAASQLQAFIASTGSDAALPGPESMALEYVRVLLPVSAETASSLPTESTETASTESQATAQ